MDQNQKPNKFIIILLFVFMALALAAVLVLAFSGRGFELTWALLDPKGVIAQQQKRVILTVVGIMFAIVIPTFMTAIYILWRYRADKADDKYNPNMPPNWMAITAFWLIPTIIITIIGVINWKSAHQLDPYKAITSDKPPLTVEVVALQWKWLFIYPEQNIATVNYLEFPENTPLDFKLTADAPMTSFWIPQLGSQVFAMAGMENQLHLMSNQTGTFGGSTTEMNGAGFSGMRFEAKSVSDQDFNSWLKSVKSSSNPLTETKYNELAKPTENNPQASYSSVDNNLFNSVMMKYMESGSK